MLEHGHICVTSMGIYQRGPSDISVWATLCGKALTETKISTHLVEQGLEVRFNLIKRKSHILYSHDCGMKTALTTRLYGLTLSQWEFSKLFQVKDTHTKSCNQGAVHA